MKGLNIEVTTCFYAELTKIILNYHQILLLSRDLYLLLHCLFERTESNQTELQINCSLKIILR